MPCTGGHKSMLRLKTQLRKSESLNGRMLTYSRMLQEARYTFQRTATPNRGPADFVYTHNGRQPSAKKLAIRPHKAISALPSGRTDRFCTAASSCVDRFCTVFRYNWYVTCLAPYELKSRKCPNTRHRLVHIIGYSRFQSMSNDMCTHFGTPHPRPHIQRTAEAG